MASDEVVIRQQLNGGAAIECCNMIVACKSVDSTLLGYQTTKTHEKNQVDATGETLDVSSILHTIKRRVSRKQQTTMLQNCSKYSMHCSMH